MRANVTTPLRLAMLGALLGLGACQGAPAPLKPTATAYRGQKARVFPNTPEEVWQAACDVLTAQGFVLREDEQERGFLHAHTIDLEGSSAVSGNRTWTRVTARIDFVDAHKRAPRSLLEVDAERLNGSAGGPIEASIGELEIDFYERFFQEVEGRLPAPRLPQLAIPGLE